MNLIDNIKAINGGGIFEAYSEDALLLGGRVLKNEQDVGLSDRKVNYFYTRFDDRPLKIQKAEIQIKSCTPYEIASPKVLVLQFKEFDLNGIMYAALNVFNENYNRLRYEVDEVDIRKEIILKQETGEVKPMEGYRLVKIKYTEYMPLDGCEDITCNGDVVIPITNDVKVYINSVLRYEPTCGTDLELTLVDQDGVSIDATYNGDEIVVSLPGDARVSNSDDSYDVNVASGGDLELPDEAITVNSAAFITKPSVKDQDILLTDQDDNVLTPTSLSGNTIKVSTGWSRPTDWLTMPSISATDRVLYGLVLVYENGENLITFQAQLDRVTIDWGDGSATENTIGTASTHNYDYSAITQTPITYNGQNVKQCIMSLTIISTSSIDMKFTESDGINSSGNNAIVDILCCFNARSVRLSISNQFQNYRRMDDLRIFKCLDLGTDTTFFWGNYSWQNLKLEIFDIPTNGLSTHRGNNRSFQHTIINQSIGDIRGFGSCYNHAVFNGGVNDITARGSDCVDATLVTCNNITVQQQDAFTRCKVNILGSITATTTNFRRLFQGCTTKRLVFTSLPSTPTSMGNNGGCFAYMGYLEEMIVPGLQNGFTIEGSNMGATALDAMFTSLGTANGTQTITITGNPGAATCDTTIATAKGFTIVI